MSYKKPDGNNKLFTYFFIVTVLLYLHREIYLTYGIEEMGSNESSN